MKEIVIRSKEDVLNCFLNKEEKQIIINLFDENFKFNVDLLDTILQISDEQKNNIKNIVFCSPYEKLPKKVILKMAKIERKYGCNSKVKVHHSRIYDFDYYSEKDVEWDLKSLIKANKEIDKVCNFVRKNKFSPFEAVAFVHDYVSTLTKYSESQQKKSWASNDQFFVGAYFDVPEIVCAGYCSLMEEIIDNLNIKGLECLMVSVEFRHLRKNYSANHARCMIKIKDNKYGLDQTFFDDPTWDNDENLSHKFCHFAMNNDCFDISKNKHYYYHIPVLGIYNQNKANLQYDQDALPQVYNLSKNVIDQKMIETAYFNVLKAKYPKENFENIYKKLCMTTKLSFEEQNMREFDGNIKSDKTQLSVEEAKKLYNQSKNKCDDIEFTL